MFSCVVDISDLHYKFMYSSLLWPTGVRSFLGPGSGMGNLTGLEIGEGGGGERDCLGVITARCLP